jgi:tetratricopeptide (TPR) repeat protein
MTEVKVMITNSEFVRGQQHFLQGEFTRSIGEFCDALEHGVDPHMVFVPLGLSHLKNGDFAAAEDDFSYALELDEKNDYAYFLRGIAYLNDDELERAVRDLDESIRLNRERGAAFVARSLALRELHRGREAEEDLRTAFSLADVEVENFMKEYCISASMHRRTLALFDVKREAWTEELREKLFRKEH